MLLKCNINNLVFKILVRVLHKNEHNTYTIHISNNNGTTNFALYSKHIINYTAL